MRKLAYILGIAGLAAFGDGCSTVQRPTDIEQKINQRVIYNINVPDVSYVRSVIPSAVAPSGAVPARESLPDREEVIFNGKLNGFDVVYKEGTKDGKRYNFMGVKANRGYFNLHDTTNVHNIFDDDSKYDKLEKVDHVRMEKTFVRGKGGMQEERALDEWDLYYGEARKEIREMLTAPKSVVPTKLKTTAAPVSSAKAKVDNAGINVSVFEVLD